MLEKLKNGSGKISNIGRRFSYRTRLQAAMIFISLACIATSNVFGLLKAQETINNQILNQLVSVRSSKSFQVKQYLELLENHVLTLSEDLALVEAAQEFNQSFSGLENQEINTNQLSQLESYYKNKIFPLIKDNTDGVFSFSSYAPSRAAANFLQYHYLANNKLAVEDKHKLINGSDNSSYSQTHQKFHPLLKSVAEKFDYEDLFIINNSGDVVYSVYKGIDFAASLNLDYLQESGLASLFREVMKSPNKSFYKLSDFDYYVPSYGEPSMFIAVPIYAETRVGVLAVEISSDKIDQVLSGKNSWKSDGLGNTGETIIVGSDNLLRSTARGLTEDKKQFLSKLRNANYRPSVVNQVESLNTTIYTLSYRDEAVDKAIAGATGTSISTNYFGERALLSFSPLDLNGLDWVIVSKVDFSEAFEPVADIRMHMVYTVVVLLFLTTVIVILLSYYFTKPIQSLIANLKANKRTKIITNNGVKDEILELTECCNNLIVLKNEEENKSSKLTSKVEELLSNLLPSQIVNALKNNEKIAPESVDNLSVASIKLEGLEDSGNSESTLQKIVAFQTELLEGSDQIANRFKTERLSYFGNEIIFACGLSQGLIDADSKLLNFCLKFLELIADLNKKHGILIEVYIGAASNHAFYSVIGEHKIRFQVWGKSVSDADLLRDACPANTILVCENVYKKLKDRFNFSELKIDSNRLNGKQVWSIGKVGISSVIKEFTEDVEFEPLE